MPMHANSARLKVFGVLLESTRPLTAARVIQITQVHGPSVRAFLCTAFSQGMISRVKVPQQMGHSYFMTPEQKHTCPVNNPDRVPTDPWPDVQTITIQAIDIPARLRFLDLLAENSVWQNHAQLHGIIADYRRTLTLQHQQEMDEERAA